MQHLKFKKNQQSTIGIEIELQILDPKTFDLVPAAEKILNICQQQEIHRVKAEIHQSMLEIDSEISTNVKECRKLLEGHLRKLQGVMQKLDLKLGVTATHPFQHWADRVISNQDRYQYLHRKFQWLARRLNVYGIHVHVGMPSGSHAIAIAQGVATYLPHLLALSANSPFWQGVDTGMQSSRMSILDTFPGAGPPPYFPKWSDFEKHILTLQKVGAIESIKDLYWHVRPNLVYGTIEFRICDGMTTLSETMALGALIHCLVVKLQEQYEKNPKEPLVAPELALIAPYNLWTAARDGIEGVLILDLKGKKQKISDGVRKLLKDLIPTAKALDCLEELSFVEQILKRGNGAQKQRQEHQRGASLQEIVAQASDAFLADLRF